MSKHDDAVTSRRMTVYFPLKAAQELARIRQMSRLGSNVDVLTASLDCYLELLEVDRAGGKIWIRRMDPKGEWRYSPHSEFLYPGFDDRKEDVVGVLSDGAPKNFVFPVESVEKIRAIRGLSRFSGNADAIRASLAAFHELARVVRRGDTIVVADRYGTEVLYSPFAPLDRTTLNLSRASSLAAAE